METFIKNLEVYKIFPAHFFDVAKNGDILFSFYDHRSDANAEIILLLW